MKSHPMRAELASFTLHRQRIASALAACGGYGIALVFIWAALQLGAQVPPDTLEEGVLATFGAVLVLMATAGLTMVALNTPIAIFTSDGMIVGGIGFLLGHKRFVPWSKIASLDTFRVRDQTRLVIQLRQTSASSERKGAMSLLWELAKDLGNDMNFSGRFMAKPLPELIAELRQRFAKELHDNRITIREY
jgi:hypothetical protein